MPINCSNTQYRLGEVGFDIFSQVCLNIFFFWKISLETVFKAQNMVIIWCCNNGRIWGVWPPVLCDDQGPSFQLLAAVVLHPPFFLLLVVYLASQGLLPLGCSCLCPCSCCFHCMQAVCVISLTCKNRIENPMLDFLNVKLPLPLDKHTLDWGEVGDKGNREETNHLSLKVCKVLFENENSLYF